MTTHPVPIGTRALLSTLELSPESVDGDPYDRPVPYLPVRVPGQAMARQHAIDSIRALADFYAENEHVPAPTYVVATAWVTTVDECEAIAAACGDRTYGEGVQFDHDIATSDSGTWTAARVSVHGPERAL